MAQRVVGVNLSNNNAERLATQADQLVSNTYLGSIAGGISSKINLTDYKKTGMLSAFAGADENGKTISTLEAQSNTYITYSLTEGDINREISIDYNIDPSTYTYTQISKIIISGYNFSGVPLQFYFFLYNERFKDYMLFYKKTFNVVSDPSVGQAIQDDMQFILPAPVGIWHNDRFGYFIIINPLEGSKPSTQFTVDVIIYQRNYLVE